MLIKLNTINKHININIVSLIKMEDKRLKSKNFTLREEEELVTLVIKYWSIVQCKITDHSNNL